MGSQNESGAMDTPLISVLMPVHNCERYLPEAVESVLAQTLSSFEFLIFDDGSTDASPKILNEYEQRDSRARVMHGPNRGATVALNLMIQEARGKYLARMDGDDVCAPERFAMQVSHLEANAGCVAVGSRVVLIDSEGQKISEFVDETTHSDIDGAHMKGGPSRVCHPTVMMRRDAVLSVGGYDERYQFAQDMDLFLRLAEIGEIVNLPHVLLSYRQHRSAVGATKGEMQRGLARKAVEEACLRRGIDPPVWGELPRAQETVPDIHRKWAWWALMAGNVGTARKHARIAFFKDPLSSKNLRLIACAIRGH